MEKRSSDKITAHGLAPQGADNDDQNLPLQPQADQQQQQEEVALQSSVVAGVDKPVIQPIHLDDHINHPLNLDELIDHPIEQLYYPNPDAGSGFIAVELVVNHDEPSHQDQERHEPAPSTANVWRRLTDPDLPPKKRSTVKLTNNTAAADPSTNLSQRLFIPAAYGNATKAVKKRFFGRDIIGKKGNVDATTNASSKNARKGHTGEKGESAEDNNNDDDGVGFGSELYLGDWQCKSSGPSRRCPDDDEFDKDLPASSFNSSLKWGKTAKRSAFVKQPTA